MKLRFITNMGYLTTEDLWDLPLQSKSGKTSLDDVARMLNKRLKETEEVSFVSPKAITNKEDTLRFDIVKKVIEVRLAENEALRTRAARKQEKEKLLAILARKQDAAKEALSEDEIKKMIEEL